MSEISVATVKAYLRVIHGGDDALLQQLVDSAEDEAARFLNRDHLPTLPLDYPGGSESSSEDTPSSEDPVAPSVVEAVCLLVKAAYEATTPAEVAAYRQAAEWKLQPYRARLGV